MNFLENLRNRLCCCNPRRLRAQQVAETARDMAMNVVNRVNDNPQPGNLAPVRYEHIVGHLGANINTRPQPVAEELHEEQPVNQPAHQPGNRPVNQPINQGSSTNSQNQVSGEQRHYSVRPSSYRPGITPQEIYPINEEGIRTPGYTERMVNDYLAEHNYSQQAYQALEEARMAQLRASQPFVNSNNIPAVQPVAQPFAYNSISAVQPVATGQVPVAVQPLDSRLMEPQIRRSNADADITLYGHGTHQRTGSIDVASGGALAYVTYANNGRSFIDMPNGGRIHRSNSITVEPGTKVEMTSSDGHTKTSIEFENGTRISHDGSFDF